MGTNEHSSGATRMAVAGKSISNKAQMAMEKGEVLIGSAVKKTEDSLDDDKGGQSEAGIGIQESLSGKKDEIVSKAEKYEQLKANFAYSSAKRKYKKEYSQNVKDIKLESKKKFIDPELERKKKDGTLSSSDKDKLKQDKKDRKKYVKSEKRSAKNERLEKTSDANRQIQAKKRKHTGKLETLNQATNFGNGDGESTGVEENMQDVLSGAVSWGGNQLRNSLSDIKDYTRNRRLENQKTQKQTEKNSEKKSKEETKASKHEEKQSKRSEHAYEDKSPSKEEKHKAQKKNQQKKRNQKNFEENKEKLSEKAKEVANKASEAGAFLSGLIIPIVFILFILLLFLLLFSAINGEVGGAVQYSSYQAEDETLLLSNKEFVVEEKADKSAIENAETDHKTASDGGGFDEYRYVLNGTTSTKAILMETLKHDGNLIASYLTAKYFDYTLTDEIKKEIKEIYEEAFSLSQYESIEWRTATYTDPTTGETYYWNGDAYQTEKCTYRYAIFYTALDTKDLDEVLRSRLETEEQIRFYDLYISTSGQKDYLFGGYSARDDIYRYQYDPEEYKAIYGDADISFSDAEAQQIYNVAQTQLGKKYKWGGASPDTGFDCSGYVTWVMNTSGAANFPRSSANVILRTYCDMVAPTEAKPGDLVFFKGTYPTVGASHVGIYLGNGKMIHCGDPCKITNITTNYWTSHFYTYGRVKSTYR